MTEAALGLDLGTSGTKAALVDRRGNLLSVGRERHAIDHPRPGWSETHPSEWLRTVRSATRQVLEDRPDTDVVAIGLAGQMHGVVPIGNDLQPLGPAILWSDLRAQPIIERLRDRVDASGVALGNPVVAGMAATTLSWLVEHDPGTAQRMRWALQAKDWLRAGLTGEVATDPSDGSATLLWDLSADRWSSEACAVFDVDERWLPDVRRSGEPAGRLSGPGAELLGLDRRPLVAVGAADTAAAILGAGLTLGQAQVSTGTGGQLALLLDRPVVDDSLRTHCFRASGDDSWYALAAIQNAGVAVDWALQVLGADLAEVADAFRATPHPSGDLVFVPYLTGERTPHMDAALSGRWVGLRADTTRSDLLRSVFEGVAFALRDGLEALRTAGHSIEQASLAGGGSIASWYRQLLADALGIPLIPHDAVDASVRGAAILGWQATGHDIEPCDTIRHWPPVTPQVDLSGAYESFRAAAGSR